MPNLIGRSGELALLTGAAQALVEGVGRFVQVVGEAGAGKTSLLDATAEHLRHHGVGVRTATADEPSRHRPWAVARGLFPELPPDPGPDPIGIALALLERVSPTNLMALLADDAHWADDASLDLLAAVARRAPALGVLLVTSTRPHPFPDQLRRMEETTAGTAVRIELAPLPPEAMATLVRTRWGAVPGPNLAAWLAEAAGNPFLAVELLTALTEQARLVVRDGVVDVEDPTALPDDLVETLARRVLLAVPDAEVTLRAAAVIPGGFTVEELAALLDRPMADVLCVALAAVDAGLLLGTTPVLTFRHDLLRQAVLASTPRSILHTLNRRAAAVLTERRADLERVATCLLAGCDPHDPADLERLLATGRSMRRSHPVATAALLRRALDGISVTDPASTAATIEAGWALLDAGRGREVGALVHERLRHLAGPRPLDLLRLEGVALSMTGRLGDAAAQYDDDLNEARLPDELDAADPVVVDAAAELAVLRVTSGRLAEARELIDWVEASSTPASSFRRASVSTARAWLSGMQGGFEPAAQHARTALEAVAEDHTFHATAGNPSLALGFALDALGDGDGALAAFRQGDNLEGMPHWAPPLLRFGAAVTLYRQGAWDDALAEAEAGLLAADESDLGLGVFWPFAIGTLVNSARGQLAQAADWLDRSRMVTAPGALGTEWLVYASAVLREAQGEQEEAETALERLMLAVIDAGAPALLLIAGTDMVRLALATGRTPAAAKVAAALDDMRVETASSVVAAIATWARGLLHRDACTIEAAADDLAAHRRIPESARACRDAAVTAARAGARGDGRRLARRAFALYDELGAQQLHARLRSELRDCGLAMRPRRSPPRPQWGWDSLTHSEQTIVDLAGEGLTNIDIAERLYISRRTVESHLGRAYTKLELSTRAQLVAAAARRATTR